MKLKGVTGYFIGLWISTLLVTTTGFSIQAVYCYCLGTTFFTLEEAVSHTICCEPIEKTSSCCKKSAPIDCDDRAKEDPGPSTEGPEACIKNADCLETTSITFSLKTDFFSVEDQYQLVYKTPAVFPPIHLPFRRPILVQYMSAHTLNKAPPVVPPPVSGRSKCIRTQIFRC